MTALIFTRLSFQEFAAADLPESSSACEVMLSDAQSSLESMDEVDGEVIRRYNEAKKFIEETENEIEAQSKQIEIRRSDIEFIRNSWRSRLDEMVGKIAVR